jgi:hypothetical protein
MEKKIGSERVQRKRLRKLRKEIEREAAQKARMREREESGKIRERRRGSPNGAEPVPRFTFNEYFVSPTISELMATSEEGPDVFIDSNVIRSIHDYPDIIKGFKEALLNSQDPRYHKEFEKVKGDYERVLEFVTGFLSRPNVYVTKGVMNETFGFLVDMNKVIDLHLHGFSRKSTKNKVALLWSSAKASHERLEARYDCDRLEDVLRGLLPKKFPEGPYANPPHTDRKLVTIPLSLSYMDGRKRVIISNDHGTVPVLEHLAKGLSRSAIDLTAYGGTYAPSIEIRRFEAGDSAPPQLTTKIKFFGTDVIKYG